MGHSFPVFSRSGDRRSWVPSPSEKVSIKMKVTLIAMLFGSLFIPYVQGIRCYLCFTGELVEVTDTNNTAMQDFVDAKNKAIPCNKWEEASEGERLNHAHECLKNYTMCMKLIAGNKDRGCAMNTGTVGCLPKVNPESCLCNDTDLCNKGKSGKGASKWVWGVVLVAALLPNGAF